MYVCMHAVGGGGSRCDGEDVVIRSLESWLSRPDTLDINHTSQKFVVFDIWVLTIPSTYRSGKKRTIASYMWVGVYISSSKLTEHCGLWPV